MIKVKRRIKNLKNKWQEKKKILTKLNKRKLKNVIMKTIK